MVPMIIYQNLLKRDSFLKLSKRRLIDSKNKKYSQQFMLVKKHFLHEVKTPLCEIINTIDLLIDDATIKSILSIML